MEFEHVTRNKSHVLIFFVVFCVASVDLGPFRPVFVVELSVVVHSVNTHVKRALPCPALMLFREASRNFER